MLSSKIWCARAFLIGRVLEFHTSKCEGRWQTIVVDVWNAPVMHGDKMEGRFHWCFLSAMWYHYYTIRKLTLERSICDKREG